MQARAIPAKFKSDMGAGATSKAAAMVAGRRSELATEWLTADILPKHTQES